MSANIGQYKEAFYRSQALVDLLGVEKFPISVLWVFAREEVAGRILVSSFSAYKKWAQASGRPCPDELKDAKCYFNPAIKIYIIVYNEEKPINRIRFSLAHELGHIILRHLNDERTEICRGGLDDATYYAMEGAANTFAGNFLAPPILIRERMGGAKFDVADIAAFFRLSREAVRTYRRQDYLQWMKMAPSNYERNILERCRARMFPRTCCTCGAVTYELAQKYCICCGDELEAKAGMEGVKAMKYPGIKLDEHNRAIECPICHNTELIGMGPACMICGASLVNECSEDFPPNRTPMCNDRLPGNARYCPYCGAESTFYARGILKAWNLEGELVSQDDFPF